MFVLFMIFSVYITSECWNCWLVYAGFLCSGAASVVF